MTDDRNLGTVLQAYPRHTLEKEDLQKLLGEARKITMQPQPKQMLILARLLAENASLAAECNAHRSARGLEPLPIYEPNFRG